MNGLGNREVYLIVVVEEQLRSRWGERDEHVGGYATLGDNDHSTGTHILIDS